MARWLVVWTAAILTAIWYMGAAVLRGEPVASLLLAVWLIAAAFGRWTGGRRLVRLTWRARRSAGRSAITAGTTRSSRPRTDCETHALRARNSGHPIEKKGVNVR